MLDKVPVAKILGFLLIASVVLLGWVVWDGFRAAAGAHDVGAHIRMALFAIVVVLFTHTMTLFYFVGTGSRIKKVVQQYALPQAMVLRTRGFKQRLFPWLTFTPLVTMAAFILGGGAHTRHLPGWLHGGASVAGLLMTAVTAVVALSCLSDNVALIDEIDAALPEGAGD